MLDETLDYATALRNWVSKYRGKRECAVRRAGDVFDFFPHLFADSRLPRHNKIVVNAVLAYFVVPQDVFPEDTLGPVGLVDDLYVAACAFRRLQKDVAPAILLDAWPADDDLATVMHDVYRESRAEVGRKSKEVLRMAGLS